VDSDLPRSSEISPSETPGADTGAVIAVVHPRADLHTFRIAHPVVRTASRFELTTVALLVMIALSLFAVVVPLELLLPITT
jgi:hypothetical protein